MDDIKELRQEVNKIGDQMETILEYLSEEVEISKDRDSLAYKLANLCNTFVDNVLDLIFEEIGE